MSQRGFLTPADDHEGLMLAPLWLYGGVDWEAIPRGVLAEILHTWNYEALPGDKTIEETIEVYQEALARTFRQWTIPQPYYARIALLKPQSLIAYWPLWEGNGATLAKDRGANTLDGTPTGHTWGAAGIGDGMTGIDLSGAGSQIDIFSSALAALYNGQEFTASFWANSDNWQASRSEQFQLIALRATTTNRLTVFHNNANFGIGLTNNGVSRTHFMSTVGWSGYRHFCFSASLSGNFFRGYMDGVALWTTPKTYPSTWTAALTSGMFGNDPDAQVRNFDGKMAHVTLWDSALSAEEIAYLATL